MNTDNWPETVPYLRESDMSNCTKSTVVDRHCVYGWSLKLLLNVAGEAGESARAFKESARQLFGLDIRPRDAFIIWSYQTSISDLAAVWNHAMPSLGGDRPYVYCDISGCFVRKAKVSADDSHQPKELEPCLV